MTETTAKAIAAVHYVCRALANEPHLLGKTKLHKTLWYADIHAFRVTGETITGASYIKHEHGPFIRELDAIIAALARDGRLTVRAGTRDGEVTELIGLGAPDTTTLTERECKWLNQQVENVCRGHTAGSISDRTHDRRWEAAAMYEELPIAAFAVQFIKPDAADVEWARRQFERAGG